MAAIGRTLFRFGGALLLGASATAIDGPGLLFAPTVPPHLPVVVAVEDIPRGAVIDRGALVIAQWPAGALPAGGYTSIDSVAGRVTRVPVFKGEAIVPGRLAPNGAGSGLEIKITPGKRAFVVPVRDVSGIADLVQPNTRVDILVVIDGGPEKGRVAKLFMEDMRVLAMGKVARRDVDGRLVDSAVATIEVTPEQAERLAIAATQGEIQLLLRGYGDPYRSSRPPEDRMPIVAPSTGCDSPARETTVRDLLRRACPQEMRIRQDSIEKRVSPRRR